MPLYYGSPWEIEKHGTTTNYFAVLGPQGPWRETGGVKFSEIADRDKIMLIELRGLKTPWMEPWDPTVEQVLDILRPKSGNSVGDCATDVNYLTVDGDVRTLDQKIDRESLRKLLVGDSVKMPFK